MSRGDNPSLGAVIVLYKQKLEESSSYKSFLETVSFPVFVYDNSPVSQKTGKVNVFYMHNPANPGVSKAYNEAIQWAKENRLTHLLLLDSDSEFPDNALEQYQKAVQQHPDKFILPEIRSAGHKISPFYFKMGKSFYGDTIRYGELELRKILGINSGTIIPVHELEHQFNENLPLDWSDVYFFRKNKKIKAVHISLLIRHGLSEHEEQSLRNAKFRFETYVSGISKVAESVPEKLMMLFWAKLKAIKLSLRYRTIWFLGFFLKKVL